MIKQIAATVTALLLVGVLVALVGHEHSAPASENFDTTAFDTELASSMGTQCSPSMGSSSYGQSCRTCDQTKTECVGKGYDITKLLNSDLHAGITAQIAFTRKDEVKESDDVEWSQLSESRCTDEQIDTQSMGKVAAAAAAAIAPVLSGKAWGLSLGAEFNQNIATAYSSNKQVSLNTCTIKNFQWKMRQAERGQASQNIMDSLAKLKALKSQAEYNQFFELWGTHVITGAAYGGRYTMRAEYGTFECNSTGTVCADASFGAMFGSVVGISGGGGSCTDWQSSQEVTSAKLTSEVVGGNDDAQAALRKFALNPGEASIDKLSQSVQDFKTWEDSLECSPSLVSMDLVEVGTWLNNQESGCTTLGGACPSAEQWKAALQAYVESKKYSDEIPAPCTGGGGGGGGVSCFSDNNTVLASSSRKMLVGEVQVGDRLNTTVEDDEVWWVHKSSVQHKLLRVQLQDSHIDLTPHHMLRVGNGFRPANKVRVGDLVHTPHRREVLSEVLSITHLSGSVSAPITMSGKIVVNGVEASCYAFGSHQVLHQLLAPFRVLYKLCPWLVQMLSPIGVGTMQALSIVLPIEHNLTSMLTVSTIVALSSPVLAYWGVRHFPYV